MKLVRLLGDVSVWWHVIRVHIDVAHRGLGTASCGPDVRPEHRIPAGRFDFAYGLSLA